MTLTRWRQRMAIHSSHSFDSPKPVSRSSIVSTQNNCTHQEVGRHCGQVLGRLKTDDMQLPAQMMWIMPIFVIAIAARGFVIQYQQ